MIEVLVAIAILALLSTLIFAAFDGLSRSKKGVARINDRHHEGRVAISRIARELEMAYVSMHAPIDLSLQVQKTFFRGKRATPLSRIDFSTFGNRRLDRDAHESDQADVSYFGSPDPERSGVTDLARRVRTTMSNTPGKGGRVELLATDVEGFDVEFLDPLTGSWIDTWDTTQAIGQGGRLPMQIRLTLVLNGGARRSTDGDRADIRFTTSVTVAAQRPLTFATQ
jgi:general secretion pathway protein J